MDSIKSASVLNMRDSLSKHQLIDRLNNEEIHDYARRAYQQKGLALIPLSEITDPFVKQEIINFCDRKYGKK